MFKKFTQATQALTIEKTATVKTKRVIKGQSWGKIAMSVSEYRRKTTAVYSRLEPCQG